MYFLRKLGSFQIDFTIMSLFYTSVIESVLTFCIIGWGGNITIKNKTLINRSIKRAGKLSRTSFSDFDVLLFLSTSKKINKIENTDHPLASKIKRSVRSGRPLFITTRTERYRKSFLPYAVTLLTYNRWFISCYTMYSFQCLISQCHYYFNVLAYFICSHHVSHYFSLLLCNINNVPKGRINYIIIIIIIIIRDQT